MDTGFATGAFTSRRRAAARTPRRSGQEDRHHGDDEDDGSRAVFHQHDEAFIGLLMSRIIIAVSGRVGHFIMLCHRSLRLRLDLLPWNYRNPTGRATAMGALFTSCVCERLAGLRRPVVPDPAGE